MMRAIEVGCRRHQETAWLGQDFDVGREQAVDFRVDVPGQFAETV